MVTCALLELRIFLSPGYTEQNKIHCIALHFTQNEFQTGLYLVMEGRHWIQQIKLSQHVASRLVIHYEMFPFHLSGPTVLVDMGRQNVFAKDVVSS